MSEDASKIKVSKGFEIFRYLYFLPLQLCKFYLHFFYLHYPFTCIFSAPAGCHHSADRNRDQPKTEDVGTQSLQGKVRRRSYLQTIVREHGYSLYMTRCG